MSFSVGNNSYGERQDYDRTFCSIGDLSLCIQDFTLYFEIQMKQITNAITLIDNMTYFQYYFLIKFINIKLYSSKYVFPYYNYPIQVMLQLAAVITTGGLLLFSSTLPIDISLFTGIVNLINDSKNLSASLTIDSLKINYLYDAILGLVYVIAWRKEIELDFPDKLLKAMSLEWKNVYDSIEWKDKLIVSAPDFAPLFERAFQTWKDYVVEKEKAGKKMATFENRAKKDKQDKQEKEKEKEKEKQNNEEEKTPESPRSEQQSKGSQHSQVRSGNSSEAEPQAEDWDNLSPRQRFLRKQQQKKGKGGKSPKKQQQKTVKNRQWEGRYSKKDLQNLDRSKKSPNTSQISNTGKYLLQKDQNPAGFLDSDEESEDQAPNSMLSRWVGRFKDVVGDKKITKEDLAEVLTEFKQSLMEKNVAQEVAVHVADAVGATLLQTKTKTFTSVRKTVKDAMKQALRKILTPKRKIDLVVQVTKQREKLKPYVIVFVGVNGVGKSTNLAKVAYKLKNAKLSVMLAACDNFRAGAVEQIETHGRNLQIPVFQKGYKQEPAVIAYEAIKDATRKHIDAVLVDTAGRMQDNTPLMKELARLVKMNKPNLVVFIGEALVGNDAVDQITKFNKALLEESTETFKPEIDAILLSKFDTVDDKVGTALSLVYSTGKPILYVGVGQKYPNLKELNVSTVVHALLS